MTSHSLGGYANDSSLDKLFALGLRQNLLYNLEVHIKIAN